MRITILDDEGKHHVFPNVSFEAGAAVMHALSGEKPPHASETGACLCTSLSQSLAPGWSLCMECGHGVHNTRVHCGAMA